MRALAERHYGPIPANRELGQRLRTQEPPQRTQRTVAQVEQRVGERWAWGWGGGANLAVGMRLMSINFETSFHRNRPETIAQLSELTGVVEWRMLMSWRVGW